jgi:diguanylate cyclase (GGDEF)-like protein
MDTDSTDHDTSHAAANAAATERDHRAVERDDAARRRDADAVEREQQTDRDDQTRGRESTTRLDYRTAVRADRATAADDRADAAQDRAASAADREAATALVASLMHDALTGFYQRGAGMVELEREVARSQRTGEAFTVAFVDIDGLKEINDSGGHDAGDRAIRRVAALLRSVVREYDVVVRYGGDEFVCGLQGLDPGPALDRFTGMQAALDEGEGVTVSIGIAQRLPDESLSSIIRRADTAMYAQKTRRGRGR